MKRIVLILFISAGLLSCKKVNDWLDVKSNVTDITPSSLADLQAIIDNNTIMNSSYPAIGRIGADNYYVLYSTWLAVNNKQERNLYTWEKEIYEGESGFDWNNCYERIAYANIVLDILKKIPVQSHNAIEWNNIKGSALFFRAHAFYDLLQLFAKPYVASTAATDLGICIRLNADVNEITGRSSIAYGYAVVLNDLQEALALLPKVPLYKTRSSHLSAHALLARIYLNMENYSKGLAHADSVLHHYSFLYDFNTLSSSAQFPFPTIQNGNHEVLFHATASAYSLITGFGRGLVDTLLYQQYDNNDLRKSIFYIDNGANGIFYKGSYIGNYNFFSGISTAEMYLIRAECYARTNNVSAALADLNTLLQKRWKAGLFTPVTATNADDALQKILNERRKELPFTGNLRWEDLRRLNKDPKFAITLKRILNGQSFTLPPNDLRYTLPIPQKEIDMSGIQQNPR